MRLIGLHFRGDPPRPTDRCISFGDAMSVKSALPVSTPDLICDDAVYDMLSQETREIRIVTLVPSPDPSLPIRCQLWKVSLDNPPWYLALSYAWGDPAITTPISLDDREIQVTTNLEAALRHMRVDCNLNLWIDAICINQADPEERGQQIQLMREIYSQAKKVIVWLGREQDDSTLALQTMHRLILDHLKGGGKHGPTLEAINKLDDTESDAIKHLFQRSWWSRLWTVQEVVLAKEIEVICGKVMLPWAFFTSWSHVLVARTDPSTWTTKRNDFLATIFSEGSWEVFTKGFLRMMYEKHETQEVRSKGARGEFVHEHEVHRPPGSYLWYFGPRSRC